MAFQRNVFGHRMTCRPLYVWMPMLLGCVALASWLVKHKDVSEILNPRSVGTLEQYLYESQPETDVTVKKIPQETKKHISDDTIKFNYGHNQQGEKSK